MCDSDVVNYERVCFICKKEYTHSFKLFKHIHKIHNLGHKQYRDLYIKEVIQKEIVLDKLICQICGRKFKDYVGIVSHFSQIHNMSSKDYYDKYFKTDDCYCKECNKDTYFLDFNRGYRDFCSRRCSSKNEEKKQRTKDTCQLRYGTDSPGQNAEVKENKKNTCQLRYSTNSPAQNEKVKEKIKNTCQLRYGTNSPFQNEEVKAKIKRTCIEKLGVENPFQSDICKAKIKKTNIEKLGVENPSQNEEVKQKKIKTNLEKRGVEYPTQDKEVKETRRKNNEEKGLWTSLDKLSEFKRYRRLVTNETNKHRKELYKDWDHCDYYTGERLITTEEFRQLYPEKSYHENKLRDSIDHKRSVFDCYKNNISVEECAKLENLCICSLSNNISKFNKTELKFLQYLKEHNIINTINKS